MAIKALFTEGATSITLAPLFQWDYGQELEIEATNLPSLIEVHFACHGMTEAVVHTCSCTNGIARVAIPDRCLEQAGEITAWVYEIDGAAGRTIYSLKIPITARTRPARSESIPQSVQDTYTQLITEVNELLESLQSGTLNVGYAVKAGTADTATKATSADTATSANTAGSATTAAKATNDMLGNMIHTTYMKIPKGYTEGSYTTTLPVGLYHFCVTESLGTGVGSFSFFVDLGANGYLPFKVYSPLVSPRDGGSFLRVAFTYMGPNGYELTTVERGYIAYDADYQLYSLDFTAVSDKDFFTIYYKKMD